LLKWVGGSVFSNYLNKILALFIIIFSPVNGEEKTTTMIYGKNLPYQLMYDTSVWNLQSRNLDGDAVYIFSTKRGNAAVMFEETPHRITYENLPDLIDSKIEYAGLRDLSVDQYFAWKVGENGYLVYIVLAKTESGEEVKFVIYMYSRDKGTVFITFSAFSNEYDQHIPEFDQFLYKINFDF
jgi:hypothetical protein